MTVPVEARSAQAIYELLGRYFDGLYHADAELLREVFHERAVYVCATDGSLTHLSMGDYLPLVAARESPAARNEDRNDAVQDLQFAGPVTALARVNCSIGEKYFTDLLSLIKTDERWWIIAKVFHYELSDQNTREQVD